MPGNSVRAQNDSALGLPSPNTPSLPEVVDRSGQPIHSDSGSSGRVPGSSFSADQAIPQSLKPEGGKANAADAQAKPNAQFPRTSLPAERSNHSASDSTDSPRELAPPPSANSGDTAPAADAVAPTAPRQYPTRRQMTPDQVIPNWVYDQAGIKPPQEPIPGPGNANPNANVPLGPRNQAVPTQQPGLSNQPPAATQPKVAPPIQPNQPSIPHQPRRAVPTFQVKMVQASAIQDRSSIQLCKCQTGQIRFQCRRLYVQACQRK